LIVASDSLQALKLIAIPNINIFAKVFISFCLVS
jgi:hypothetical protein